MADSSSSSSFSSSSSYEKDQWHQATAQVPPLNKKPAAGEQQPQPVASPSSLGKKPAASKERQKVTSAAPAPIPAPTPIPVAADDVSDSINVASDSPPKYQPVHSSKPDEPPSAAASQQMRPEKKRKQQQDGASVQEGEAAAASAGGLSSKKPFQKVWAEDDEIALLEVMLSHPTASDISVVVGGKFSKKQTSEKLRKLKKKYKKHLRWGEMGVGLSLTNSHDQRVFELSKKVWPTVKSDAYDYADDDDEVRTNGEGGKMGCHGLEQRYPMLGEALHLLEEDGDNLLPRLTSRTLETAKLKALESQWEKHFKAGVKYCLERARMKEDLLELIVKLP